MTADDFRHLALQISGAIESVHGGHPDFRVGGRVFASLGAPDESWGMVKLTPEEQAAYIAASPPYSGPATVLGVSAATQTYILPRQRRGF
jgi:hypothetical protein